MRAHVADMSDGEKAGSFGFAQNDGSFSVTASASPLHRVLPRIMKGLDVTISRG